jgi:hypothetical protein
VSRYAEGTSVSVDRSRAEAEKTLARYGAIGFMYGREERPEVLRLRKEHGSWCDIVVGRQSPNPPRCTCGATREIARAVAILGFKMKLDGAERQVRLEVPMPHEIETGNKKSAEAAERQRWRALVLVLKAKLEAVASGISTVDAEFMAAVVMPNGMTLGQAILPRLTEVVTTGRLLPAKGE